MCNFVIGIEARLVFVLVRHLDGLCVGVEVLEEVPLAVDGPLQLLLDCSHRLLLAEVEAAGEEGLLRLQVPVGNE